MLHLLFLPCAEVAVCCGALPCDAPQSNPPFEPTCSVGVTLDNVRKTEVSSAACIDSSSATTEHGRNVLHTCFTSVSRIWPTAAEYARD